MIRRALNHQPMFSADRAHIHHKLLDLGLTHKQAVLLLYGASGLLGITALLLTVASGFQTALILVAMEPRGSSGSASLAMVFSENPRPCRRSSKPPSGWQTGWGHR